MKKTIQLIVLILIFSCNNSEKKNKDKTQNDNAESTTYFMSGLLASGCNTLGRSEHIRVPLPAAKITTLNVIFFFYF